MSVLSLLGKGLGIVASLVGIDAKGKDAVETVRALLMNNPELEDKLRMIEFEEKKLLLAEAESVRGLYKEELKSSAWFVKHARPAMLWLTFVVLSLTFGVIPLFNTVASWFGGTIVTLTFPTLPEEFYWLVGSIFGLYTGARSYDKTKSNGK